MLTPVSSSERLSTRGVEPAHDVLDLAGEAVHGHAPIGPNLNLCVVGASPIGRVRVTGCAMARTLIVGTQPSNGGRSAFVVVEGTVDQRVYILPQRREVGHISRLRERIPGEDDDPQSSGRDVGAKLRRSFQLVERLATKQGEPFEFVFACRGAHSCGQCRHTLAPATTRVEELRVAASRAPQPAPLRPDRIAASGALGLRERNLLRDA